MHTKIQWSLYLLILLAISALYGCFSAGADNILQSRATDSTAIQSPDDTADDHDVDSYPFRHRFEDADF